jgi:hypothetical protein
VIPDGERILGDYLREHPGVGVRIRTTPPKDTTPPWVMLVEQDGPQGDEADHLVPFYFQLDCYAGLNEGMPEVKAAVRAVREALTTARNVSVDGAVISSCRILGQRRLPDPGLKDQNGDDRQRVILTARVWMHS